MVAPVVIWVLQTNGQSATEQLFGCVTEWLGKLFLGKYHLPVTYVNALEGNSVTRAKNTPFGYPGVDVKGSILGPLIYVLYTSDLPTSRGTTLGTFADDSAMFTTHEDTTIASLNLQEHISSIEKWLQKWKIKVNESKSQHITCTLRKGHCSAVNIIPLTPNGYCSGRTAPLTSRRCILNICSTIIRTEYFQHAA
jgi:hypothetical protein